MSFSPSGADSTFVPVDYNHGLEKYRSCSLGSELRSIPKLPSIKLQFWEVANTNASSLLIISWISWLKEFPGFTYIVVHCPLFDIMIFFVDDAQFRTKNEIFVSKKIFSSASNFEILDFVSLLTWKKEACYKKNHFKV